MKILMSILALAVMFFATSIVVPASAATERPDVPPGCIFFAGKVDCPTSIASPASSGGGGKLTLQQVCAILPNFEQCP